MWHSSSAKAGDDAAPAAAAAANSPPECSTAFQRLSSERGSGRSGENAAWNRSFGRRTSPPPLALGLVSGHQVQQQRLPSPGGGRIPMTTSSTTTDQEGKRTNLQISFPEIPAGGALQAFARKAAAAASSTASSSPSVDDETTTKKHFLVYNSAHSTGKLKFDDQQHDFKAEDLDDLGEIGRGNFGTVNKMRFGNAKTMAVKRIRSTVDEREQKELLMDLEVVMKSSDCHFIVTFFGAIFKEGDCWICMELMDSSLDQFYKLVYDRLGESIPEEIIGKITVATVMALNYLKEQLKIIHRDVKPSNILIDRRGAIKLCDFGISGQLIDSIAKTRDAGCRPYMAPERINPQRVKAGGGYDVRSDVWSLGITLFELATGKFPYPKWNSVFEQLHQVVDMDPPRLEARSDPGRSEPFTLQFVNFVNTCLIKDEQQRPKYTSLLKQPFIQRSESEHRVDVAKYVGGVLDRMGSGDVEMTGETGPR